MPSNDPDTGVMEGKATIRELMAYRRVDPGARYKAVFGVNVIQAGIGYEMRVGDVVEVLETGEHDQRGGIWNQAEEVPVTVTSAEAMEGLLVKDDGSVVTKTMAEGQSGNFRPLYWALGALGALMSVAVGVTFCSQ